jgi:DNA-binding transcriptional LysR family regulator
MNFRQIEAFRAVMACGTTTRAAEVLRVAQPAISRLLSDLERSTKLKLFDRGKGRIRPTTEAHAFYDEVQRSFIGLERLRFAADNIRSFSSGTLRVASLPVLGNAFLPRAVGSFSRDFPDVSILLHIRSSEAVKHLVASGQFEIGFAADEIDRAGVHARVIVAPEAVCIMPHGHPLAARLMVGPTDLADARFVSLAAEDAARARIDRVFVDAGVSRRIVVETQYSITICNLVRAGAGVALVNPLALEELDLSGLAAVPFRPRIEFRTFLITPPGGSLSRISQRFIEIVERQCSEVGKSNPSRRAVNRTDFAEGSDT